MVTQKEKNRNTIKTNPKERLNFSILLKKLLKMN